jgi:hypothetical protein
VTQNNYLLTYLAVYAFYVDTYTAQTSEGREKRNYNMGVGIRCGSPSPPPPVARSFTGTELCTTITVRDSHGGGWSRKINAWHLYTLMVYL